jgi:hypothetical protein
MPVALALSQIEEDRKKVKLALQAAGVPSKVLTAIETRALRTGRKTTGEHATNRESRWKMPVTHPQYGTEADCKAIFVKLCALIFCFDKAPALPDPLKSHLEKFYVGHPLAPGTHRDSLLLERFDFDEFLKEATAPQHGYSGFHLGHEDPSLKPKHQPENITWRTFRSNLIQGDMTLRAARIYFVKLIGRYFELGEIDIA